MGFRSPGGSQACFRRLFDSFVSPAPDAAAATVWVEIAADPAALISTFTVASGLRSGDPVY